MSAPSWSDLEALFHEALGRAPGERAAFLAARCAGHSDLQAEVEALLRAHDTAASALEVPPVTLPTRLQTGARLGPYEVLSELGAGAMGEVYRARDTKLGRHVALKVLPVAFAADADRLARFTREARTLASLNHPGIAIVHGLEQAGDVCALVMELVEGEDLSAHIARGPIPLAEALPLAKQIAEALEAAHEQGIVHRDLKPANIKVRADGTVKVLDFGLAKLADASGAGSVGRNDGSRSPTLSPAGMTGVGVIIGTAAYMAPEQARGRVVDKRADIWAFGVVLYEMVSGRRLFGDETVSDTLAAVLKETPAWEGVPAEVLPLLRRCLEKDPRRRLRDIGDAMALLEEAPQSAIGAQSARRAAWIWPGVAALLVVALASLAMVHYRERPPDPRQPTRFQIAPPENVTLAYAGGFAISPDGRQLVFAAAGSDNVTRLWIRALDSLEARPLSGTELSVPPPPPFWSPDSRFVAFDAGGKLKKVDITGGPAITVCDTPAPIVGGSWNRDGVIIFALNLGGVMRVSAAGGVASPLTELDSSRREVTHVFPSFLPDGRHFLYLRFSNTTARSGVYVGSLDLKPDEQNGTLMLPTTLGPVPYVPRSDSGPVSSRGQLLFRREGTLMAQPFDDRTFTLSGESAPVAEQLGSFLANGFFSASTNGVLIFWSGIALPHEQPTWFDRHGTRLGLAGDPGNYFDMALSPDMARAAAVRLDVEAVTQDLWLLDFAPGAGTRLMPLTFGPSAAIAPVWSPDGSRLVFGLNRDGRYDLYEKPVNSVRDEEIVLKSNGSKTPTSWSRDGRFLLYTEVDPATKNDVWVLSLEDRTRMRILGSEYNEDQGRFSNDGRLVAYVTDESGRSEVWVREFAANTGGGKWLVSSPKVGGSAPRWRADTKELFYLAPDGTIMAVDVTAGPVFQAGTPKPSFKLQPGVTTWDVTADGARVLVAVPLEQSAQAPLTVVLNWPEGLKK